MISTTPLPSFANPPTTSHAWVAAIALTFSKCDVDELHVFSGCSVPSGFLEILYSAIAPSREQVTSLSASRNTLKPKSATSLIGEQLFFATMPKESLSGVVATQGAPKSIADLETLLKDDIKVKVAGASDTNSQSSIISGWDIHDTVYSKELLISNRANGYRDLIASIDLATYRRIPWENNVPFFLVSFLDPDTKEPICADPRGVLRKVASRAQANGWRCIAGCEYELNTEYFNDLFDESLKFQVPLEGHHTETGPGVYETALAYTDALRMADNAILFKFLAKSVDGKSLFALGEDQLKTGRSDAQYEDTKFLSQEGEWFLAGVLDGLPDVMPMLVPTINGYKRLVGGEAFWAPNAVTYGYDSRAASVRIISPPSVPPSATRLEVRVPGADMNPYFALSAIFALGLRGIEKKLKLPGPPVSQLSPEDKKTGKVQMLPQSLEAATERMMRPDSIAREEAVFGSDFVDHFGGTRQHEVHLWNEAVTNWEVERYLELA
ncbi:hypothetical protein ACG7TL_003037 [Trametes sanguinea]